MMPYQRSIEQSALQAAVSQPALCHLQGTNVVLTAKGHILDHDRPACLTLCSKLCSPAILTTLLSVEFALLFLIPVQWLVPADL